MRQGVERHLAPGAFEGLLEEDILHTHILHLSVEALNDGVAEVLLHAEGIGGPGGDGSVVGSGYELLRPERCAQTQSQDKEKELLLHGIKRFSGTKIQKIRKLPKEYADFFRI